MKAALRAHRRETDPPEPTLPSGRLEEMQGVRGRQSGQRAAQNERYASSNPHIDAWWASATQAAPEDAYKRLIDACRLAVEEACTSHGVAIGSYAEASGVGGAGMRFFDNFLRTASRQGLWPPWWTFADVAAVKKLTRRRASASCTRKRLSDVTETLDVATTWVLRLLACRVYDAIDYSEDYGEDDYEDKDDNEDENLIMTTRITTLMTL
jgi:hypothetical protein